MGKPVPGYLDEPGVAPDSATETYAALKLFIDNWRWAGVPFYLRTGKRMAENSSAICIRFKSPPRDLLRHAHHEPSHPNWIMLGIQPNDCLKMEIQVKVPGLGPEYPHASAWTPPTARGAKKNMTPTKACCWMSCRATIHCFCA